MPLSIYDTAVMTQAVQALVSPGTFLLRNFFSDTTTHDQDNITFDRDLTVRRLADFVPGDVAARARARDGFETKSFSPPSIKEIDPIRAGRVLKRMMGEAPTGRLSPAQREMMILRQLLIEQKQRIQNRHEWMAASALTTGKIICAGRDYPTTELDFGRDAALQPAALAGANRWLDANAAVSPYEDVETWIDLVSDKSSAPITDIIFGRTAWKQYRKDPKLKDQLDVRRMKQEDLLTGYAPTGQIRGKYQPEVFRGTVGAGVNVWTYSNIYKDPITGSDANMFDPNQVVLVSRDALEGEQAFGAIEDTNARFMPLDFFADSWVEKNPGMRQVMTQSRGIVVMKRPNASFAIKVA